MKIQIYPGLLKGSLQAPASKSCSQRAAAASLARKEITRLINYGHSDDEQAALDICSKMGAQIERGKDFVEIIPGAAKISGKGPLSINCGESGLSCRMFTPLLSLRTEELIISGNGSLQKRPMTPFKAIFNQLGIKFSLDNKDCLPLHIYGPMRPLDIEMDGSISSQFLTGMLLSYSAAEAKNVTIKVNNLKSKPYIDLTLKTLEEFKLKVPQNHDYSYFHYNSDGSNEKPKPLSYPIESDWSSGAFLLVAGTILGDITVNGLRDDSLQADKAILKAIEQSGAKVDRTINGGYHISSGEINGIEFDATDCPDLFPPLAVLAGCAKNKSIIKGCNRLRFKESDRANSLKEELGKMGIEVTLNDDFMIINPNGPLKGAELASHNDHRIAMACTLLAMKASGTSTLSESEAINKSYPNFYRDINSLAVNSKGIIIS